MKRVMKRIGLTGSMAMGKSTVAAMLAAMGVRVHDADAAVAQLYGAGGGAAAAIAAALGGGEGQRGGKEGAPLPTPEGAVDKEALRRWVWGFPARLRALERVVHPLLAAVRAQDEARAGAAGAAMMVYDVPLLFETSGHRAMDAVIVVSAPAAVQRARALARPTMTPERFAAALARQTPDALKRARADFIIDTGGSLDATRAQLGDLPLLAAGTLAAGTLAAGKQ